MSVSGSIALRMPVRMGRFGPTLTAGILLAPTLFLLVGIFLVPLGIVLAKSLTDPKFGFQNYEALWRQQAFRLIMLHTFEIAIWTTLVCLVLAYPLAYYLTTIPTKWAKLCLGLCLVPLFTSIIARLYAWTVILGARGVVNSTLQSLGIINQPLELLFNRTAVIVGMSHVMLPYMILILYGTMVGIDTTLMDAADTLGAGFWRRTMKVLIPLSMPGVYAGILLVFIVSLGFFITPAVLGGGSDVTIATYVEQEVNIIQWGVAMSMCMVLLIVTGALFLLFSRFANAERVLVGGVRK
jgi:putative spermidine/putrescine transport system permease protein